MASFDANVAQQERDRLARLESDTNSIRSLMQQMGDQSNYLTNQVQKEIPQPPPQAPPPPRRNLNLSDPPKFFGNPSELQSFKVQLCQFMGANYETYIDSQTQILFSGSHLLGPERDWYESFIDPVTVNAILTSTLVTTLNSLKYTNSAQ